MMKLRKALEAKGWEAFSNPQGEEWNTIDLLNDVQPGDSPEWLDADCNVGDDYIIDCHGEELKEFNEETNE